ncbi:putative NBD/HSP70 family sugar kinase [Diaminobutyricimonas aerilata]|uniref:Putative NBD/HSP70 family sugar kinase n=2 Tax=Diaminobutyricimonas aerilata TaxID=1162967 RepID=A0A2M9CKX3_9MICO|nr:putative NBD/HSP70 family sugar kinase [Diaminobutyricimonas aerilata]
MDRMITGGSSRALAREVLVHGPLSRGELARRLGLSLASLTRLAQPLLASGFLVEESRAGTGNGRPARPLAVRADTARVVGLKVSGDDVSGVLTDLRADPRAQAIRPLGGRSVAATVDTIARVVSELSGDRPVDAVGVSLGGSVDRHGVVRKAPFLGWTDVPLQRLLGERLRVPVVVENDVVALARAEHWFGEGRGRRDLAVITIGVGVGYALVIDDRVVDRPDAGVGLAGHVPLDADEPPCDHGHRGCAGTLLSSSAIERRARDALGVDIGYDDVMEAAARGDEASRAALETPARGLGRLIGLVSSLAVVDTVVLAGEGVALAEAMRPVVAAGTTEYRHPDAAPVDVRISPPGFDRWSRGAAATAIQHLVVGSA